MIIDMKDKAVGGLRKILPSGLIHFLEEVYRRSRAWLVAARFGFPAQSLRIIGITGTNGKTTTAVYLNEILKQAGLRTALFSTAVIEVAGERKANDLNRTVALAVSLNRFLSDAKKAGVDWVVLEVTSHALQQHKLDGVNFEAAVMTNLTQDHMDYHGTMEAYAAAKAIMFSSKPRFIVLNRDDDWFDYFNQFEAGEHKMTYGTVPEAEARIVRAGLHRQGSDIELLIDHQTKLEFGTLLPGKFNVYNATAAATLSYLMHISLEHITNGIESLETVPGRLERVEVEKPYDVIVDYAHSPDALEKLLEALKELTKNRVILVFGACGDRDKGKRPIMGKIAAKLADRIIVTDEESYNEDPVVIREMILDGIREVNAEARSEEIADRREAIEKALNIARPGDTVVITGMGHEQFRIEKGKKIPWNDAQVVKEVLETK